MWLVEQKYQPRLSASKSNSRAVGLGRPWHPRLFVTRTFFTSIFEIFSKEGFAYKYFSPKVYQLKQVLAEAQTPWIAFEQFRIRAKFQLRRSKMMKKWKIKKKMSNMIYSHHTDVRSGRRALNASYEWSADLKRVGRETLNAYRFGRCWG